MRFALEALRARHGDCLLLHYGPADAPRFLVIDGGPSGTYAESLEPRLEQLRGDRDELRCSMLMVSHIDDDHIGGVLKLMRALRRDTRTRLRFDTLWHNAFDDLVGEGGAALEGAVAAALPAEADEADSGGAAPVAVERVRAPLSRHGGAVVASVGQGRQLRDDAEALGITVNLAGAVSGELISARDGSPPISVDLDVPLTFRVLAPSAERLADLQAEWDDWLERKGLAVPAAEAAEFVDRSVFNLASIVVLAELDGHSMLLTGDARGDDILRGLGEAALLDPSDPDAVLEVDILKMPHHGSDRNVATEFFRRVVADHYVMSGNGKHHNPEVATFRMLFDARGTDSRPYTIHLTYGIDELRFGFDQQGLRELIAEAQAAGHPVTLSTPDPGALGLTIELGEPA